MALIEGVGDEVTVFAGVLILLTILLLAWISTGVVDRPLVSIIVLDGRTFQHFLARLRGRRVETPTDAVTPEGEGGGPGSAPTTPPTEDSLLETTDTTTTHAEPAAKVPGEAGSSEEPAGEQAAGRGDSAGVSGVSTAASTPGSEGFVHLGGSGSEGEQERTVPEAASQCEPTGSELRQRRLAFFNNPQQQQSDSAPTQSASPSSVPTGAPSVGQTQPRPTQPPTQAPPQAPLRPDTEPLSEPVSAEEEAEEFTHLDGHIRIRIKYLDDRQRWVQARPEETIGQFKRAHFGSELTENTMIRFIFNGRELTRDSQSLASYNISDESVIHCLVSHVNRSSTDDIPGGAMQFDVGSLVFPLFGLILALIWYSRFSYRHYFNTMSTLTLIAVSFLFVVALLASFRNAEHGETAEGD